MLQKEIGPRLFLPNGVITDAAAPSRIGYYLSFAVFVAAVLLLLVHLSRVGGYLMRNIDMLAFLTFATIRQYLLPEGIVATYVAFQYIDIYLATLLVASVDGPSVLVRRLFQFSVYLVMAHLVAFALPSMSVMRGGALDGAFRGLATHRNVLAMQINLAMAVFLTLRRPPLAFRPMLLAACVFILVAAGSAQALILTIIGVTVFALYRADRLMPGVRPLGLLAFVAVVPALYLAMTPHFLEDMLGAFGRDATFTGRTQLWSLATYMIERQPWLGYGMQHFTSGTLSPELLDAYGLGLSFGSSHSSYLEAVMAFGRAGAALFFIVVARHTARACIRIYRLKGQGDALPIALTVFCVLGGLIEAERLFQPGIGWLTFVVAKLLLDVDRDRAVVARDPNATVALHTAAAMTVSAPRSIVAPGRIARR